MPADISSTAPARAVLHSARSEIDSFIVVKRGPPRPVGFVVGRDRQREKRPDQQTDEEAGGVGSQRRVVTREMVGDEYFQRGSRFIYYDGAGNDPDGDPTGSPTAIPSQPTKDNTHRERPLKTVIAKDLRITDEAYNLTLGENATQTYGFRGTNRIFAVLGEVDVADLVADPGFQINPNHSRLGSGTGS